MKRFLYKLTRWTHIVWTFNLKKVSDFETIFSCSLHYAPLGSGSTSTHITTHVTTIERDVTTMRRDVMTVPCVAVFPSNATSHLPRPHTDHLSSRTERSAARTLDIQHGRLTTISRRHPAGTGISDFGLKWAKLAPNNTNPEYFQIR